MHLKINGKQIDIGESLRSYVDGALQTATAKYFPNPIEGTVVFSREAHLFHADVSVHVGRGILLQSFGESDDIYHAFDKACDKIAKRLRRHKRRLRDHHANVAEDPDGDILQASQYVIGGTDTANEAGAEHDDAGEHANGNPVIIAETTTEIQSLTVGDAVMRMELAELPALMFRNPTHGGLNMVYRRPDGHVGWVDPRGTRIAGV